MNLLIAGSRDYPDLQEVRDLVKGLPAETQVIVGGARGVDVAAEGAAIKRPDLPFPIVMQADWETYGKRAGYIRNEEMVKLADFAVVFWDGVSRGSEHTINLCKRYDVPCVVVRSS
jgi:hypothetical protein